MKEKVPMRVIDGWGGAVDEHSDRDDAPAGDDAGAGDDARVGAGDEVGVGGGAGTGARLSLHRVSRSYQQGGVCVRALADVSFDVAAGESVAVVGPSGSGKSTLLQVLGAMDRPDVGSVSVDGDRVERLSKRAGAAFRRRVGFVFQHYHLLPHLSAVENVMVPVMPVRVDFDPRERAHDLLSAVGLGSLCNARANELSGGEQQRVAIARALIGRPRLLLADEPTGALDSRTGEEVLDLLAHVQAAEGMTMVLATHDASVAAQCTRLIRLRDGMVVGDDAVRDPEPDETLRRFTGLG